MLFLEWLKGRIRFLVRMLNPPDLIRAFSLARMQEESLQAIKRGLKWRRMNNKRALPSPVKVG